MTTRDIVQIALFAAITAALALFPPVTMPIAGVPITAQSLAPMLAGSILGARRGGLAIVLFLVLVAAGLPLLAGGRGGIAVFFGVTGGFMFGWIAAAFLIGFLTEIAWRRYNFWLAALINIAGGIGVVYALGVPWVAVVAKIPFLTALGGSAVFIPGDIVKAIIASAVAVTVKRAYPVIRARA